MGAGAQERREKKGRKESKWYQFIRQIPFSKQVSTNECVRLNRNSRAFCHHTSPFWSERRRKPVSLHTQRARTRFLHNCNYRNSCITFFVQTVFCVQSKYNRVVVDGNLISFQHTRTLDASFRFLPPPFVCMCKIKTFAPVQDREQLLPVEERHRCQ